MRRFDDFDVAPAMGDIQLMRSEWKADPGEMKAESGELKAELHAREARLIKWVADDSEE